MRRVLLGFKHRMVPIPWFLFIRILKREAQKTKRVLGGLDDEHRRVHHLFRANSRFYAAKSPQHRRAFLTQIRFFWSEEHARRHRKQNGGVNGIYLTLAQNAFLAPIAQDAPFDFTRCPINGD